MCSNLPPEAMPVDSDTNRSNLSSSYLELTGLIQVKEEGWTGFSEGWQGCSKGFPEGEARGKTLCNVPFTPRKY